MYQSGSCSVFATPVIALATGISTIFTLSASSPTGGNIRGFLLAVYPDAGGAPGYPPLLDAVLSSTMCWQQSLGTSNASLYGYTNKATWADHGTVMCNITGAGGLAGRTPPPPYYELPNSGLNSLWSTHYGKSGIPLVQGTKYWVAFTSVPGYPPVYFQQADSNSTAGAPMTAALTPTSSCPGYGPVENRYFAMYPPTGSALSWAPSSDFGTGLAINFCTAAAQPPAPGAGVCMVMPPAAGSPNRRLSPEAAAMVVPMAAAAEGSSAAIGSGGGALAATSTHRRRVSVTTPVLPFGTSDVVSPAGLLATTGLSWSAPTTLPAASFLSNCSLVASPVVAQSSGRVAYIAASVAVKPSTSNPWQDWRQTRGDPYVPGLNFGVYADTAGTPGALLWSAYFAWNDLEPVIPARNPGTAYWRPYNTFYVNLLNLTSTGSPSAMPLSLVAGSTYWLAVGGAGNRNDTDSESTLGNDWTFQQSAPSQLPAGYAAKAAVVSIGSACNTTAFPTLAAGSLVWAPTATAADGSLDTGGPAVSLCNASSPTACTELPSLPTRLLPPNAIAAPAGSILASTGVNVGATAANALSLPASYFSSGCSLLAAPVTVLATGTLMAIRLSISGATGKLRNGAMLGIYADGGG